LGFATSRSRFLGYNPSLADLTFAERLRAKRRKLGLTQYQLAEQLGVYNQTITLLKTGKEVTNERTIAAVRRFVEGAEE